LAKGPGSGSETLNLQPETSITVFTTRPDTLFGATYMVLSPEHKLVDEITTKEQAEAVKDYRTRTARKSDLERTELSKEKTGVFTGAYAINPVNGENSDLDCRLRFGQLRHGRDHGRARARHARLRIRQEIQSARHSSRAAERFQN
jgi:hypothetical protein